jgi:hypothetical protein
MLRKAALFLVLLFSVFLFIARNGFALSFYNAVNYGAEDKPISVGLGDFDGDTHLDLAVVNYGSDTVSILLGNGTAPL